MTGLATRAIHAASHIPAGREVAPSITVSTTFRNLSPAELVAAGGEKAWDAADPNHDLVYSRYTQPTMSKVEAVLTSVIGQPTLIYASGLAAIYAVLLLERPDVIAHSSIYHGALETIKLYQRIRGQGQVQVITLEDDYPKVDGGKLLVWLETPVNPTGESLSIQGFADKAHAAGGKLFVDATFGPPPLQDPFKWGADLVMSSATKYFAGHSDALAGIVSTKSQASWQTLWHDRTYSGSTPGSLEAWLVLRSIKTLDIRVRRQSETATLFARWLAAQTGMGVVERICFDPDGPLIGPGRQMESGPACFAVMLTRAVYAEHLPHELELFVSATSLGGVETLVERRVNSDPHADPRLLRLSIGLEDLADLQADWEAGTHKVLEIERNLGSPA